jgi:hypothetical protein
MISKCANPQCAKTLMRLDGGRFFGFHTKDPHIKHKKIENFWLCANCAKSFTLHMVEGEVKLRVREHRKIA